MIDIIQLWMVFELLIAVTMWPFLLGVYLIVGSRQWRAGQGSAGRLWRVAGLAATLAALPMLIWLIVLLPPYSVETSWWFALGLTGLSTFWVGWKLWLLMGGPLRAVPFDMNSKSMQDMHEHLQAAAKRRGVETPDTVLWKLMTESGFRLPGLLVGESLGSNNFYIPIGELSEQQTPRLESFRLAVAMAPGECWWQLAVVPFAAVFACFSSAFVGILESAAVGVVAFVGARWVVTWMFKQSRREEPVYFVV